MVDIISQHGRTQKLLLISKLLDCRENISPFTLVVDSLEQSAKPLLAEYVRRAKLGHATVVFISFATLKPPKGTDSFVRAYDLAHPGLLQEIKASVSAQVSRCLVIIDTLYALACDPNLNLVSLLSSIPTPTTSLVAVYHVDQPLPTVLPQNAYAPRPLTLLKFLATTIFTTHSFSHVLAENDAVYRSGVTPLFGLHEEEEGVVQSIGCNDARGLVIEMEHRRKSGRTVGGHFFMPYCVETANQARKAHSVTLLEDHPLYRRASRGDQAQDQDFGIDRLSFDLNLTEKQLKDREGVVAPYTDAQQVSFSGEGGRILYDMDIGDDFDEEEDEI